MRRVRRTAERADASVTLAILGADMNRDDFRQLTRVRLAEAEFLLGGGYFDGAYYLSGYAVECALKACIARKTRRHDFPPKPTDVRDMYTHDLGRLVRLAGLESDRLTLVQSCSVFELNWSTVKDWSEESRYSHSGRDFAENLYLSITDRRHGIMRWLRKHW